MKAYVFPGQGAQFPGMGKDLYEASEEAKQLFDKASKILGNDAGTAENLITYVKDRPGHDKRYAIDANKLKNELGWEPSTI